MSKLSSFPCIVRSAMMFFPVFALMLPTASSSQGIPSASAQTCPFDDGRSSLAVDGLILTRFALGITGAPLVAATGISAVDAATVESSINCPACGLNITGNAMLTAADATIISRKLAGFSGDSLTNGLALGSGARNTPAAVQSFLLSGCGTAANGFVQGGNAFGATAVLGTNDDTALEFRVRGNTVMRFAPHPNSPNIVAGSSANYHSAGRVGVTVIGGGLPGYGCSALPFDQCSNAATNDYATIIGGFANTANGDRSTVTGGASNRAIGSAASIGGGYANLASASLSRVGGGSNNRASDAFSVVAGGDSNVASGGSGAIGGGRSNTAAGDASTVPGGTTNAATAAYATVGGGYHNTATGLGSAVSGGGFNSATGEHAAVAGGGGNTATGNYAFVAGGIENEACGAFNFVAGKRAKSPRVGPGNVACAPGNFVFADNTDADFGRGIYGANQFLVRATGGGLFELGSGFLSINSGHLSIQSTQGAYFDFGASQWSVRANSVNLQLGIGWTCFASNGNGWNCSSDRNLKRNLAATTGQSMLAKVAAMPVYRWQPKDGPNKDHWHVGPMAQDFYAAFALGDSDKSIGLLDAAGVALAAIQGLNEKVDEGAAALTKLVREKDAMIATLTRRVAQLETVAVTSAQLRHEVAALRRVVEAFMASTASERHVAVTNSDSSEGR